MEIINYNVCRVIVLDLFQSDTKQPVSRVHVFYISDGIDRI